MNYPQIQQRFKRHLPKSPFKNMKQGMMGAKVKQGMGAQKPGLGKPKLPGGTPTPGAPTSTPPSGPPVQTLNDSQYQMALNNLQTNYNDQNLALANREFGVREQFGFDPQFAANPYTRAAMLQRAANQRFNSTTNTMAGRGQLYSGATSRARAADAFTSGAETDAARREYQQLLSGIEGERLAGQREMEQGSAGAYQEMVERYLSADPDSSLFADSPGASGKAPKPPKGKGGPQVKGKRPEPKKPQRPSLKQGIGPYIPPKKKGKK